MKIRFNSSKERNPTQEQGLKVLYAPGKRVAFRLRWYLIVVLIASPLVWFAAKLLYGAWIIDAPAQLVLPTVEIRARDAARVEHLAVRSGDTVKAGALLVEMDNPEWRQRLGLLQSLTTNAERPAAPGDSGLRGVLARQLARANEKLATLRRLRQDGAATEGELLAAASERDQRESDLLAFDQRAAEQRRQPLAANDTAAQKAEATWLDSRLKALSLHTHEDAVVSDVVVNEGENVGSGTLLMRIQRTSHPMVVVYLDPADDAYAVLDQPLKLKFPDGRWLPARIVSAAHTVGPLPETLRLPFAGKQSALVVSAEVDGPVPAGFLVNQLPLVARFPHDFSRLLPWRR